MGKQSITAGLDIGSNKVCCVAGTSDEQVGPIKILSAVSVPCDGIKAGAVLDIREAALSIGKVFEETEKVINNKIENIIVALRGNFIKSKSSRGMANINSSNMEVTRETVENALESAKKQLRIDPDQEVLQIFPREYILNQQNGIHNPIGMEGTYIEVDVHAFTASSSNIRNIKKAIGSVGANYNDKVCGYLVASEILTSKEEKELSCLLIDFGGLTTGLVCYIDGTLRHADEISNGSDYITRDIGHKLRTTYSTSKEIKESHGAAFIYSDFKNGEFEYTCADGRNTKKCDRIELVEGIIMPRVDRILYEIKAIMEKNSYGCDFLSGGIILTGGGSSLPGLAEAFEKAFNCSVKIGVPPSSDKVKGPSEILLNPSYITAMGAVVHNFSTLKNYPKKKLLKSGIIAKISNWLEETF
jgi:cell division protein FtsA